MRTLAVKKYNLEILNSSLRILVDNTNLGEIKRSSLVATRTSRHTGPSAFSTQSLPNEEAPVQRMKVNLLSGKHVVVSRSDSNIRCLSKIIDMSDFDSAHLWSSRFSETSYQNATSKVPEKFQHLSVRG